MIFDLVGVKCWFAMPSAGFTGASGFDISNPEVGCPLARVGAKLSSFLSSTFPDSGDKWLIFHTHSRIFLRSISIPFCFHQHSRIYLHFCYHLCSS